MNRSAARWSVAVVLIASMLLAAAPGTSAQTVRNGSISGSVKDDTGGTLPGVTVTVTSPALQVPQLTKVSDDRGEYQFVDLPLGTYRLTFELSGFTKLVREGITLTNGFAARVDAALGVATLEETVTVSGASPVVDVTNTRGGATLTNEVLQTIPNSRTYNDVLSLTPGMVAGGPPQIGQIGFGALSGGYKNYGLSGQERTYMDGVNMQSNEAPDFAIVDEVDIKTFGNTAETPTPGAQIQLIVKSGGNDFTGRYKYEAIHNKFQSSNLTDTLRAQGLSTTDSLVYSNEFIGDLGGRIQRDRLWFYSALRLQSNERNLPGYSKDAGPDNTYGTGDDTPGRPPSNNVETTFKLSYQATPKHKLVGLYSRGLADEKEALTSRFIPYESSVELKYYNYRAKAEWQGALTDRLFATSMFGNGWYYADYFVPEISQSVPSRLDRESRIVTGTSFDSRSNNHKPRFNWQVNGSLNYFPASFLGGSHEFKAGYNLWWQYRADMLPNQPAGNYQLIYDRIGGVAHQPVQIAFQNRPVDGFNHLNTIGSYISDTWRASRRLTANLGLRLEHITAFAPEQVKVQGPFGNAGTFPRVDAGEWTGLAPRAGVAWDLSGDGKTVLKSTYGWYNHTLPSDEAFASAYNGNTLIVTTYRWRDLDGNNNYTAGEVDLNTNGPDFVSVSGGSTGILNPDLVWTHTHEMTASLEREFSRSMATRVLYVYKRTREAMEDINIRRPYSAYTIPVKRRDPGPDGALNTADDGGSVTLFDYDPAFRGSQFVGVQRNNRPSDRDDSSQSLELLLNKRTAGNWSASTSFLGTKYHRWLKGIAESPNDEFFPLDETWELSYRLSGSYRTSSGIGFSGLYTLTNGVPGQRTYLFRTADPDGGRPLSQLSTLTMRLEPFGAHRGPARQNLNLRALKRFNLGGSRGLEATIDALNALNAGTPWTIDYTSGPTFGFATRITTPRVLRFGLMYEF